jgi:hypothetical protein
MSAYLAPYPPYNGQGPSLARFYEAETNDVSAHILTWFSLHNRKSMLPCSRSTRICIISQLAASKLSTSILTPDPTSSSVMIATGPLVASML